MVSFFRKNTQRNLEKPNPNFCKTTFPNLVTLVGEKLSCDHALKTEVHKHLFFRILKIVCLLFCHHR